MIENKFEHTSDQNKTKGNNFPRVLQSIIDGSILTKAKIIEFLPFFFYLMGLALLLIFNTYYTEKKVKEKEELRKRNIELRIQYITTKSELMFITNQSEIANKIENRGLVESTTLPVVIGEKEKNRSFLLNIFDKGINY